MKEEKVRDEESTLEHRRKELERSAQILQDEVNYSVIVQVFY